ncbi:hypothetical protein ES319_A11G322500v1 [Gossypium barbadense]|uniref:Uncharacterized protein n=2 Tax=Gossypium TaxID=3633 RepID=A0A5J5TW92_GOSBA|nr:hypothetical protein ES319_A11G322500v1 [Gossypium barbadense]TYG96439.1 hypothetical protein ES288_A11G350600v1 [Gossypium darwinii]
MAEARPTMSSVVSYLDGVASFPDDLNSCIKAREFPGVSNDELMKELHLQLQSRLFLMVGEVQLKTFFHLFLFKIYGPNSKHLVIESLAASTAKFVVNLHQLHRMFCSFS